LIESLENVLRNQHRQRQRTDRKQLG
jgi:hypothetical protein